MTNACTVAYDLDRVIVVKSVVAHIASTKLSIITGGATTACAYNNPLRKSNLMADAIIIRRTTYESNARHCYYNIR